jgi:hypothetical protein
MGLNAGKRGLTWIRFGLVLVFPVVFVFGTAGLGGAQWTWSLTLAIHDLKYYPDQLFPASLEYPIDFDVVAFPDPVNDLAVQVPLASEVTWVNRDRNPSDEPEEMTIISHLILVRNPAGMPVSPPTMLAKLGQSMTVRFDEVGEYTFLCLLHPEKMKGQISVRPYSMQLVQRR